MIMTESFIKYRLNDLAMEIARKNPNYFWINAYNAMLLYTRTMAKENNFTPQQRAEIQKIINKYVQQEISLDFMRDGSADKKRIFLAAQTKQLIDALSSYYACGNNEKEKNIKEHIRIIAKANSLYAPDEL